MLFSPLNVSFSLFPTFNSHFTVNIKLLHSHLSVYKVYICCIYYYIIIITVITNVLFSVCTQGALTYFWVCKSKQTIDSINLNFISGIWKHLKHIMFKFFWFGWTDPLISPTSDLETVLGPLKFLKCQKHFNFIPKMLVFFLKCLRFIVKMQLFFLETRFQHYFIILIADFKCIKFTAQIFQQHSRKFRNVLEEKKCTLLLQFPFFFT